MAATTSISLARIGYSGSAVPFCRVQSEGSVPAVPLPLLCVGGEDSNPDLCAFLRIALDPVELPPSRLAGTQVRTSMRSGYCNLGAIRVLTISSVLLMPFQ